MTHWLPLSDPSDVSVCRRNARQLAQVAGFSQARTEEIAIVVSEAATNVLRYAKRGRCLLQRMPGIGGPRLAVIVVDQGPGIDALDKMMRDGSSSEGSAGLGLGAMQRLSDQFDIYSNRDEGTVVACEFQLRPYRPTAMEVAGLLVTHPGETRCGDAWDMTCVTPNATPDGRLDLILCDGLGHGHRAADAAERVLHAFGHKPGRTPAAALADISVDIADTRGAVAACVAVAADGRRMSYASVGNIATIRARLGETKRFATRDGHLGGPALSPYSDEVDLQPGDTVILHSDGLLTLRDLHEKPALLMRSALLIAGKLMAENFRGRDDASLSVIKIAKEM
ncbi:ATP-binding protein [Phaeobacter inhibens]|uniref:ATP-binding protein n=1 Tax=Phaeobacter inhibens TaxID=221822 RepID=UPI000C9C59FF|nr:ATP-binding protein [Phaeobacter inhibens]AUQ72495.1 serine/threonine-protein kinase RsbT-like protein [Phaeobacter inhibens]UWR66637.1 ATP-binding protein [Phaeobacter inhibens]UWR74562.1 ATP-binding protein [Phaeobacter inhibens]UWR86547.1 ATP-binding protein [Phaeobacter inhibens]UWR98170.1 ATP-binding protein [Phaeobacter inhibens]